MATPTTTIELTKHSSTTTSTSSTTTTFKPRIRILSRYRYLVESSSSPGTGHQVDVLNLRCGCPAGKWGKRCKHLVLALGYEEWRKRQHATAAAEAKALRAAAQAAKEVEVAA